MTDAVTTPHATTSAAATPRQVSVLLFSDDANVRDRVRVGLGRRPTRDIEITEWRECATADAVFLDIKRGKYDVLILDGESQPYGGLGVSKQLHQEVLDCPPVIVIVGRAADGWLAAWSECDDVVIHPVDPVELTKALTRALDPERTRV